MESSEHTFHYAKVTRCSRTPTIPARCSPGRIRRASDSAAGLRLPTGLYPALAAAVAVQVGTAAYGIANHAAAGLAVALAGVAVFLGVAAFTLYQFRRINGVRVDGLASQIVLGAGAMSTSVYVVAFGSAAWAALESRWWLVAAAAVAGGVGYAFGAFLAAARLPAGPWPPTRRRLAADARRARRARVPGLVALLVAS